MTSRKRKVGSWEKAQRRKRNNLPDCTAWAIEQAEACIDRAYSLIAEFEDKELYDEPISEEELISELNYIRDQLDDCTDDGWDGYRDAMDALSNRLWKIGVAWPRYLPWWSWADVVCPKDLQDEISETCLYRDDLLAIRSFGDALKCRFKEAVHILVEHARETMPEFPKEEKKPCLKKRKSSKR